MQNLCLHLDRDVNKGYRNDPTSSPKQGLIMYTICIIVHIIVHTSNEQTANTNVLYYYMFSTSQIRQHVAEMYAIIILGDR